jgi:hypothetical protein
MNKLSLSPENLHVESFPTEAASGAPAETAQLIPTRPECANTIYDTCDC